MFTDNHTELQLSETNDQHHTNKSGSINYEGDCHNGHSHLGTVQGGQNNGSGNFTVTNQADSINGNVNKNSNNGNNRGNHDGDDMSDDSESEDNQPENNEENQAENAHTEAVGNNDDDIDDIDDLDINMDMDSHESAPPALAANSNNYKNDEKEEKYGSNSGNHDGENNHAQDGENQVAKGEATQNNQSNGNLNYGNNNDVDKLLHLSDDELNKFLNQNPNFFNSMTCGENETKNSVKDFVILDIQQPKAPCDENETIFKFSSLLLLCCFDCIFSVARRWFGLVCSLFFFCFFVFFVILF